MATESRIVPTSFNDANKFYRQLFRNRDIIHLAYSKSSKSDTNTQTQIRLLKDILRTEAMIENATNSRRQQHLNQIIMDGIPSDNNFILELKTAEIPQIDDKQLEKSVMAKKMKLINFEKCQQYFNSLIASKLSEKMRISNICTEKECIHQLMNITVPEVIALAFDAIVDLKNLLIPIKYFSLQLIMHQFATNGIYFCKYCINELCNYQQLVKLLTKLRFHYDKPNNTAAIHNSCSKFVSLSGEFIDIMEKCWFDCIYSECIIIIMLYFVAKFYPKILDKLVRNEFDLFYFTMQKMFDNAAATYAHKKYGFDDKHISKVHIGGKIGELDVKYIDLHQLVRYVWIVVIGRNLLNNETCLKLLKRPSKLDGYNFGGLVSYHYVNSDMTLIKTKKDVLFPGTIAMAIVYNYCYQKLSGKSRSIVAKALFDYVDINLSSCYGASIQNIILPIWSMIFDENYKTYNEHSIFGEQLNKLVIKIYKKEKKSSFCSNVKCNKTRKNSKKIEFRICTGCALKRYCSKKCQKVHWKFQHRYSTCNKKNIA